MFGFCILIMTYFTQKNGENLKQLTFSSGYDAEATVAFDGSKILYTSIKSGDLDIWS